jgi:predicted ATPase
MAIDVDFSQLRTSWTKYDAVQVMDVIYNLETLNKFKNKEAIINEPILKSFLGIKSLMDDTPKYWVEIQNYPNEKKLFALFSALFMHGGIINEFANKYSKGDMKGTFIVETGKQYTNIRSALVESGAAHFFHRRSKYVPFDFSPIFQNADVGKLFKQVLIERISRLTSTELMDADFYEICFSNNFHKALSLTKDQFKSWLEGLADFESSFIEKVNISNFFCVEDAQLDFKNVKEIYFLGENGDGKSLILMAIYLAFNGNYITEKTDQEKTGKAADIIRNNKSMQLSGFDDKGREYNPKKGIYLNNLFGYGTHRGRYSTDKPEEYGFMSLFDSEQTLLNPVSWLKDQKLLELQKRESPNNAIGETTEPENYFPVEWLQDMFYDLLEKHVQIKIEGNEVYFIEKGSNLTFDQLSEGYRSILIFVSDLIYRLNKSGINGKKITDLKGIVLVDEIDLHLHPKWQRVLVGKLRKLLPNVQFIFTTHSPTIIQGASEDAMIYRVYRNTEDGKTRVSDPYYRKDLDHLMINTVLTSPLFGLNDSRMNPDDDNADTSDTYLLYRVNKKLEEELERQKADGKEFIKDDEIDELIQKIINDELKNDKN